MKKRRRGADRGRQGKRPEDVCVYMYVISRKGEKQRRRKEEGGLVKESLKAIVRLCNNQEDTYETHERKNETR